ncbi:MAG: CoA-disulfide reductase [Candidatus Izemoplasmataceae bacterium]|uniref:CoA-disulfide reductase n=1 Tax=Liberiplasma polymorphum TaxID=3374570 RepID=UPI003770F6CA
MHVVIIGGVAAGMSTASKLKRLDESIKITVFEKGTDVSYGACGLPYFLSDLIQEEKSLIARTVEKFKSQGIDVYINHEVIALDETKNTVKVVNNAINKTFDVAYDKLVIATGAHAIRLPVDNHTLKGIYTLNSLEDGRRLKKALQDKKNQRIAIIGGGYIGLEVAENLLIMEKEIIVIEREERLLTKFAPFISDQIKKTLQKNHIQIYLEETVKGYEGKGNVSKVVTDKAAYDVDLVIEAVGIKPNTEFLKDTTIKRLKNGAIITNENMETNIDNIYAAGDCVSYYHRQLKTYDAFVPLGTHANKAGRVIAEQIAGDKRQFDGVLGSTVLKVCDLEIARTGISETEAIAHNIPYDKVKITAKDRAGYYPDATPIEIELIYHTENCQLLGAEMLGNKGVAHRINTVAVALASELTAQEYSDIDFAYAPPFSPVYDPLQVATNQIKCIKKKEGINHEK